jgi:hypothetical protein
VNLIVCFNVLSKLGDLSDGYFGILKKKKDHCEIFIDANLNRYAVETQQ